MKKAQQSEVKRHTETTSCGGSVVVKQGQTRADAQAEQAKQDETKEVNDHVEK